MNNWDICQKMQRQVGSIFRIVGDPVNHRGREKIDGKLGLLLSVEGALDPGSSRFVYASLLIDGEVVSYYFYESELELIGCTGV